MDGRIGNVVFDAPYAGSLERYHEGAATIATLYAPLLGMRKRTRAEIYREANYPADAGDEFDPILVSAAVDGIGIAFESQGEGYQPPRWPDPSFPQQLHLDVVVADLVKAEALVLGLGATKLRDGDTSRTYADPVGHPFCLRVDPSATASGRIGRIVFDCFSPRSLAAFYADLMDMPVRVEDTPQRVIIAHEDGRRPMLAFQHACRRHRAGPIRTIPHSYISTSASTTPRPHRHTPCDSGRSYCATAARTTCSPIPLAILSVSDGHDVPWFRRSRQSIGTPTSFEAGESFPRFRPLLCPPALRSRSASLRGSETRVPI